ncbi:hypothetical protein EDD11_008994 [Mortierella claussenii]|nr:hypothetical protein EDD11_008994 [Mortierella claussenii]
MAVTTRKRAAPAAAPAKKNALAATKKAPAKRNSKKTPVEEESEEEEEEEEEEDDDDDDDEQTVEQDDQDEAEDAQESSDEETFKIHTPKASTEPRIVPAALPTMQYEDEDSDEEDSDAAPEAESLSSAKAKVLSAQDKEKSFLSKVQAEQKAKRMEREEKLRAQKEQAKKKAPSSKTSVAHQSSASSASPSTSATSESTTRSGLPTMLPMDILESVAEMDSTPASSPATNDKKRKHMRPEDFALMELEAELKAEAAKRKKAEKTQKNVGPVTVKVLEQSHLAKGHAVPETIVDFRKQHFFGSKIQRKDSVLNLSQRNLGAAGKFNRRK